MIKTLKQHKGIILLLIVAAALRFSISTVHGYSNDELSAINRLRFDNYSELVNQGIMQGDMHPAGVQFFLKGWSTLFGTSEFALRFPFVICGLLSVVLIYILGLRWHSTRAGLFAAGMLATLYFPVLQSELARPYSPGLFFTLLSALFIEKVLFCECNKWRDTILLAVAFAAGTYTHYFCTVTIAFMYLTGLIFLNRNNVKYYFIAGALACVLHLPHIGITMFHTFREGGLQWLGAPDPDWIFHFLFHAFNESWWVVGAMLIILTLSLFFRSDENKTQRKFVFISTIWFFGIYLVGHSLSVALTPVLKFPVMLFSFPFFLLLVAFVLARISWPKIALVLLLCVTLTSTIREKDLFGNMHFENFREIAEKMVEWKRKYGEENIYTIFNVNNPDYLNFYANRMGDTLTFDRDTIGWGEDNEIRLELRNRKEDYCIVGFSGRVTTVNLFETVRGEYGRVVERVTLNNSSAFLLTKLVNKHDYVVFNDYREIADIHGSLSGWNKSSCVELPSVDSDEPILRIDSHQVYGPSYSARVGDLKGPQKGYLKVYVLGKCDSCEVTITVSARRNEQFVQRNGENFWLGADIDQQLRYDDASMKYPRAQFSFELPDFLENDDTLTVGLWKRNNDTLFLQSMTLSWIENIWNPFKK